MPPATTFHRSRHSARRIGRPISSAPKPGPEEDDMTPQERQLIDELFDRLASLENAPRDPDAEAMISEGLRRRRTRSIRWCRPCWCRTRRSSAPTPASANYEQRARRAAAAERAAARLPRQHARRAVRPRGAARLGAAVRPGGAPMGAPPGIADRAGSRRTAAISRRLSAGRADAGAAAAAAAAARSSAPRRRLRPA